MVLLVQAIRGFEQRRQERPIEIRHERRSDIAARERLLDAAFGPGRLAKTSERLREGRMPADRLAFAASDGSRLVGTLRLWRVTAGLRPCLLLGPLAVAADMRQAGIGASLMLTALEDATALGHAAVLLVGDPGYYERFGFSAAHTGALCMPGPYEPHRLLGCELQPGALKGARGLIAALRPQPARQVPSIALDLSGGAKNYRLDVERLR